MACQNHIGATSDTLSEEKELNGLGESGAQFLMMEAKSRTGPAPNSPTPEHPGSLSLSSWTSALCSLHFQVLGKSAQLLQGSRAAMHRGLHAKSSTQQSRIDMQQRISEVCGASGHAAVHVACSNARH